MFAFKKGDLVTFKRKGSNYSDDIIKIIYAPTEHDMVNGMAYYHGTSIVDNYFYKALENRELMKPTQEEIVNAIVKRITR